MGSTNGALLPQLLEVLALGLTFVVGAPVVVNALLEIRRRRSAEQHFLTALAPRLAEDTYMLDRLLEDPSRVEDMNFPDLAEGREWDLEEHMYLRRYLFDQIFKTLSHLHQEDSKRIKRALYQPSVRGRSRYLNKALLGVAQILRESGRRGASA